MYSPARSTSAQALAAVALLAGACFAAFRKTDAQAALERYGKWLQNPRIKLLLQAADLVPRIVLRGRARPGSESRGAHGRRAYRRGPRGPRGADPLGRPRGLGKGLARLNRRSLRRVAAEREAAQARLKALHAQGETDPQKLTEAGTGIAKSCLMTLAFTAATAALRALVIVRSPRRQSVEQRLAGLIVVRHRSR